MELQAQTELSGRPALEQNDSTALTKEQQNKLNQHKRNVRIENEQYLRQHPEVSVMLSSFVSAVLLERPEKIRKFAAEYFTDLALADRLKEQQRHLHNKT